MNLNPRILILAVVALGLAVGTGLLVQGWMEAQRIAILSSIPKPEAKKADSRILVAKRTLPAGLLIKPRDVEWRAWPKRGIAKSYAVEGRRKIEDFTGAVVRKGISAGEPISEGRMVKPGQRGFMAAVLSAGMRAISIQVDSTSGIAGFVFPGDRVDLLLTQRRGGGNKARIERFSETLLEGVRILAMDQNTNDENEKAKLAKTATLEVTPKQAEMIAVAVQLGKLSFSLRSLALVEGKDGELLDQLDGPAKRGESLTADTEVSLVIGGNPNDQPQKKVDVIRGNKVESLNFLASPSGAGSLTKGAVGSLVKGTSSRLGSLMKRN